MHSFTDDMIKARLNGRVLLSGWYMSMTASAPWQMTSLAVETSLDGHFVATAIDQVLTRATRSALSKSAYVLKVLTCCMLVSCWAGDPASASMR